MEKRKLIGSIFPEKLVFGKDAYRIFRINEGVQTIYSIDMLFRENKKKQTSDLTILSQEVNLVVLEPFS